MSTRKATPAERGEWVRRVEEAGYRHMWMPTDLHGNSVAVFFGRVVDDSWPPDAQVLRDLDEFDRIRLRDSLRDGVADDRVVERWILGGDDRTLMEYAQGES